MKTVEFVELPALAIAAKLTIDPEPFYSHIDTAGALAVTFGRIAFGGKKGPVQTADVNAEIHRIRAQRKNKCKNAVFLIIDGKDEIEIPNIEHRVDLDDFSFCLNAFSRDEVRSIFRPRLYSIINSLSIYLEDSWDTRIETFGEISYLVESGKAIYNISLSGGDIDFSISGQISNDSIAKARRLALIFPVDGVMAKVCNLLVESQKEALNPLRAFVAAWSALEIFINNTFKSTYEIKWIDLMSSNCPVSALKYFEHLKSVMSGKHRLTDKFVVISSILLPSEAESDIEIFVSLKNARDKLFHTSGESHTQFPIRDVQKLLHKYMGKHLENIE